MVRRYYITGGNNEGDPAVNTATITDSYFVDKEITGVFKEGFRYYIPGVEWSFSGDTISILNGVTFDRDEVVVVEVGNKQDGTTCTGTGFENNEVDPYLPDIVKCIVARVNSIFENRVSDQFSVYYGRGLYQQVGNDRLMDSTGFILIWLVMPFTEFGSKDKSYYADAVCDVFIATQTDGNYTQQQREDLNFYPRLLPVYKQFIEEIKRETKLDNWSMTRPNRILLPYWGGGDVAGPGQPNLWKNYVDCIKIPGLKLKIENTKNCTVLKSF